MQLSRGFWKRQILRTTSGRKKILQDMSIIDGKATERNRYFQNFQMSLMDGGQMSLGFEEMAGGGSATMEVFTN